MAVLAAFAVVLSPAGGAGGKQEVKLDGLWEVESVVVAGKKVPDDALKGAILTVKGKEFSLDIGGKAVKGSFKTDDSKTPKHVDSAFDDGMGNKVTINSIYEVKGDTMRVCGALGKERPKEFSSTAENGYELVTYKRAKK
jgi:uncharacterized protein (TIGR03067 family)